MARVVDDNVGGRDPQHHCAYTTFTVWAECPHHPGTGVAQRYQCRCGATELRNWRDCSKCPN